MKIFMANHSSPSLHYLAGKYGRIGWLLGPKSFKRSLFPWLPVAYDNDAWSAFQNDEEWDEGAWIDMIHEIRKRSIKPEWVLCPDKVGDKEHTLKNWFSLRCNLSGFKTAFAVQDGMVPQEVPLCDVIFVGGSTKWKWKTLSMWTGAFPRVHVGRVNTVGKLIACERLGVESVDGTGWFRRPPDEWYGDLEYYFQRRFKDQSEMFESVGA